MLALLLTYRVQFGYTALHDAAQVRNLEIIELLLASGAQASVISNDGITPLDLALDGGHDDVCQLLITSMESDPHTSQLLEHRQGFQQSSNPSPSTTQDTHTLNTNHIVLSKSQEPGYIIGEFKVSPQCNITLRTFSYQIVESSAVKQTTTANKT